MRVIVITDEEGKELLDKLELKKFRESHMKGREFTQETEEIHRAFVYIVANWLNKIGWRYTT